MQHRSPAPIRHIDSFFKLALTNRPVGWVPWDGQAVTCLPVNWTALTYVVWFESTRRHKVWSSDKRKTMINIVDSIISHNPTVGGTNKTNNNDDDDNNNGSGNNNNNSNSGDDNYNRQWVGNQSDGLGTGACYSTVTAAPRKPAKLTATLAVAAPAIANNSWSCS